MKSLPRIAITDLHGDVLVEVVAVTEAEVGDLLAEIAAHLGPRLGIRCEVARNLLAHEVRDGMCLPDGELDAAARRAFAADLAAHIAPYFAGVVRNAA